MEGAMGTTENEVLHEKMGKLLKSIGSGEVSHDSRGSSSDLPVIESQKHEILPPSTKTHDKVVKDKYTILPSVES
jgi:hypothetical protein